MSMKNCSFKLMYRTYRKKKIKFYLHNSLAQHPNAY